MCVLQSGKVSSVDREEGIAIVSTGSREIRAFTVLCPAVERGQWVVMATGLVVRQVSAREARRIHAMTQRAPVAVGEGGTI
jgi:hydrogenase maturation factor